MWCCRNVHSCLITESLLGLFRREALDLQRKAAAIIKAGQPLYCCFLGASIIAKLDDCKRTLAWAEHHLSGSIGKWRGHEAVCQGLVQGLPQ